MAQLVVRDLPEETKERLRARAKANGRSLEAEVRDVLERATREQVEPRPGPREGLGSEIARRMKQHPVDDETWKEFDRALGESRRSWKSRDVDFGE